MRRRMKLTFAMVLAALTSAFALPQIAEPNPFGPVHGAALTVKKPNDVNTRAEALAAARDYAKNNCPRPGTANTRRCLDADVMSNPRWYSPGRWEVEIGVWECWKVDPFCKDRKSARAGASREIRINYNGTVTPLSGWRNFP